MSTSPSSTFHPLPPTKVFAFMGFVACALGYVFLKDNPLPRVLFLGGGFLGVLLLYFSGFFRLEGLLYLFVVCHPFSYAIPGDFGNVFPGLNLTNILIALITVLWLRERDRNEPVFAKSPLNRLIAIFLLIGLFSIVRGAGYGTEYLAKATVQYYRKWIVPAYLFFLFFNSIRNKETVRNIVLIIMMVTTLVGLMAIYEYRDVQDRVRGIFDQPNFLAAFFNYYMFLPFGFFVLHMKKFKYWAFLIPFLIQFRGVMVTSSRAGYLASAVSLYAVTYFRSKLLLISLILVTAFVYYNPAFLPEGIRYRVGQTLEKKVQYSTENSVITTEKLEVSAGDRVRVWEAAKFMIKDHPVFGVGFNLFEAKVLHYWAGRKTHDPHNTYLWIAAEMGLPALLIFILILWRFFSSARLLFRKTQDPFSKALALGFLGGFFGLLVTNIYGSRFAYAEAISYFWILTACIMRLNILEGIKKS